MTMHTIPTTVALALCVGCGPAAPPRELTDAVREYTRASTGPAAEVVPAELHKARAALDAAERAFARDPHGARVRDLAYVATRKAALAAAAAQLELARRERATGIGLVPAGPTVGWWVDGAVGARYYF